MNVDAAVLPHITTPLPSTALSPNIRARYKYLPLADPHFDQPANVDLILGADVFTQILINGTRTVIHGQPAALQTLLGWTILGALPSSLCHHPHSFVTSSDSLDQTIQRFWEVEEVPHVQSVSPDDQRCENLFNATTTRDDSGRYIVALPFKENAATLENNRNAVLASYRTMENRLNRQPEVSAQYHQFMAEYLALGHMYPAPTPSDYLIPHHCVLKASSSTTKLRVVFNASSPDCNSNTLNQQLMSGPKLQKDLPNLVTSFRFFVYAICADIKMMYRQILVRPADRGHQHILYRASPNEPFREFELATVTYGLTPSAYLALRTLKQLVHDEGKAFPLASNAILHQTYVDDIVTGADAKEDAQLLIRELNSMFARAGLELRKWSSNEPSLLEAFPDTHLENPLLFQDDSSLIKILGLQWNPASDNFSYKVQRFNQTPTKRTILSYVARTFDPLGLLTPVTFWIKLFIKQLWQAKLDWDQTLTATLQTQWQEFSSQFPCLEAIQIPRHVGPRSVNHHILGFCDGSESGYAASLYLRSEVDGIVTVQLLLAKSKVAPLKVLTIPRLELCGAVLLTKLYESLKGTLSFITNSQTLFFTDSEIVLHWLCTQPHQLKTFVANRIVEITSTTTPDQWFHISTLDNPADVASRGCLPSQLADHHLWWHGPKWLEQPPIDWPLTRPTGVNLYQTENRTEALVHLTVSKPPNPLLEVISKYSDLEMVHRIFSYVLRFIKNCRIRNTRTHSHQTRYQARTRRTASTFQPPSVPELNRAQSLCVKLVQQQAFPDALKDLQAGRRVAYSLRPLTPFIDSCGLLRVGGRLQHSSLSYEAKHPLLLPKKHHYVNLICDHYHRLALHAGPRTTQAMISREFWIVALRSLLRQRIHACLRCFRMHAKPTPPIMADLPSARVTPSPPFNQVGIDFAGPFDTKANHLRTPKLLKAYLCLFVCMATKAVHLELVADLSTDSFFAAFHRFTARRGLPAHVYTDNGTNFTGASNRLKDVYRFLDKSQTRIQTQLAEQRIAWHFNPPASPHFGGLWEAAIKSAKQLIHRTIGHNVLTLEELSTLFIRVEAILNSRPIFDISPDPNELVSFLTPGHFLIGRPLLSPPAEFFKDPPLKSRWSLLQHMSNRFWKIWSTQYLHTQMQRRKWNQNSIPLTKGQLVFISGEHTDPLCWPMGRIMDLHPGPDHVSRVATIQTAHALLKRPVHKLIVIPPLS